MRFVGNLFLEIFYAVDMGPLQMALSVNQVLIFKCIFCLKLINWLRDFKFYDLVTQSHVGNID